jgi:hypothetical protein
METMTAIETTITEVNDFITSEFVSKAEFFMDFVIAVLCLGILAFLMFAIYKFFRIFI